MEKSRLKNESGYLCLVFYAKTFVIKAMTAWLIISVAVFQLHAADSLPDENRISLVKEIAPIKEILKEVERQTEFTFFYNHQQIDVNKTITVNLKEVTLKQALEEIFKNTAISYRISGRQILLFKINSTGDAQGLLRDNFHGQIKNTGTLLAVTGTVTSESGETMPGVNVIEKGTANGTTTDGNGKYSITVTDEGAVLIFSFIGYSPQEISLNARTQINVILTVDVQNLDEVVVVGYGTQKKINLTGSVSTLSEDVLDKRTATQSSQLLQGAASGVTVTQNSGSPGRDQADIIIRGLGTFSSAGNNPLVLVDGVPSSLNAVSPNDIATISVLKDAASASIYGSRAANGVILITTKEGQKGKLQINYESYISKQEAAELPQYVNSWTYAEMMNEARNNMGLGDFYTQEEIDKYKSGQYPEEYPNTPHVEDIFHSGNGLQTRHNISFNGKEGGTQFLFSAGYLQQNGIIKKVEYDRYDLRLNLISELRDNLKLSVKLSGNFSTRDEPAILSGGGAGDISSIMNYATSVNATIPGKKADGSYGTILGHAVGEAGLDSDSFSKMRNTFFTNNISLEWNILKSLKFTNRIAYNWNDEKYKIFGAAFSWSSPDLADPQISKLRVNISNSANFLWDSYLDYEKTFGENHHVHVLGGFSHNIDKYEALGASRDNIPSTKLHVLNAASSENDANSETASSVKLSSFFGRVNYRYQEKYLLEANIRYDGSSRFPKKTRFGLFPSFSAAWIISNEPFFQIPWIESMKIRSSYGFLGNQQIGSYPYQKTLNINQPYPLGADERLLPGIALTTLPFQDIKWETVEVINEGVDVGLFEGKINLSVDRYIRNTSDILYNLTVSSVLGMAVSEQNAGEVENKGWDFELTYKNSIGDFSYSVQPNFSINNNKVVSLAGVEKDIDKGLFVGEPLGSIYGYRTEGLFVDQNDIDTYAVQNYAAKPGHIRYKDISGPDGVPDGKISAEYDRTVIGNTFPKYSYGLGLQAAYKGFDFYLQIQGLAGFEKRLDGLRFAFHNYGNIEQWQADDHWSEENPNPNAAYPRLQLLSGAVETPWGPASEYWLKDTGFMRIKTVQIGYTIPSKVIEHTFINQLRIYVSGQNLLTFDHYYPGWDPEMATGGYANSYYYPPTRLWTAGINVNF